MSEPNPLANELPDEIIESIRTVRAAHAAALGFDVARIVADLREKDATSGDLLVSLRPKPARRRPLAAGQ